MALTADELDHQLAVACEKGDVESCFVLADYVEERGNLKNAQHWRDTAYYRKALAEGRTNPLGQFGFPLTKEGISRVKKVVKAFGYKWPKHGFVSLPDGSEIRQTYDGPWLYTDNYSIEAWAKFGPKKLKKYAKRRLY